MAKVKIGSSVSQIKISTKKKRPGVHAKSKSSKLKSSKNYTKFYKVQGK